MMHVAQKWSRFWGQRHASKTLLHVAQKWSRFWGQRHASKTLLHVAQKWSRFWDNDMLKTKDRAGAAIRWQWT
ncbi:hypothetical protein EOC94_13945 [Mesorhizobium sp. M6A.T.Ce.TU.016.01.1.1]|nr:hypothetical protein EOC94_13945 [Mesorhizobium sp. M6A.T.Ce.TU.016.01.1.1]